MSAVQRSKGGSSTAAAAYRAGAKIVDQATGEVHDYTKKQGVLHTNLMLPGGQQVDRGEFWSDVELHHRHPRAVTARELRVALPAELDALQRNALAEAIGRYLVEKYGVAADVCVHAPDKGGDDRNFHVHILMSACSVGLDGALGKKVNELDPIHCQRHKIENAMRWPILVLIVELITVATPRAASTSSRPSTSDQLHQTWSARPRSRPKRRAASTSP